ncbi:MAG: single-stranded-DNA-specific exonuclease RecJ [Bdellovibrionaceae bacterium]|nr:single-stranded-DNA-specific exonuclease RecJ [Pseudobdellovibrionaceae bacterium]
MAIWKRKSLNSTFEKNNAIPDLVWRFLSLRVKSEEELNKILNPTLSELKDPLLILNMDRAVQRLIEAFEKDEKICIYADFDLDGTSGLAILNEGLKKVGYQNVIHYQPKRLAEGYGFHPQAVEDLQAQGVKLIVTVDVGITSFAAFQMAKKLNVDAILTDHHLPIQENGVEKLPEAFCIVNPNQKQDTSGLNYLCGAGVAFYLLRALKRGFYEKASLPKNEWDLKEVLDFLCIGTLTDMVPLVEDNRVLVKHGMKALQNTVKPGLRELLERLNLDQRELTSQDVAIKFAPKLNALSRMESDVLPRDIYLETEASRAKGLVDKMMKNNETRQSLQHSSVEKAEASLSAWTYKDFNFISSKDFHRGIIGLIATKIANDTNKPTFIGSEDLDGMIVGSSRLPNGYDGNLVLALASAEAILNRFGGHAAAAGFEFSASKTQDFIQTLNKYYTDQALIHKEIEIEYDTEAGLADLTKPNMKWYNFAGPYGVGFSIPIFRFNNLVLNQVKEIRGGHIKMTATDLSQAGKTKVDILYFSPTEKKKEQLKVGQPYDILGEIQINYFNKTETTQILMKDFISHESK